MDDDPARIALAMDISRRTVRIVYQNIVFALAIKAACLALGALGLAGMWLAIFADVGVMVLAVLNATRALYTRDLVRRNTWSAATAWTSDPLLTQKHPPWSLPGRMFRL